MKTGQEWLECLELDIQSKISKNLENLGNEKLKSLYPSLSKFIYSMFGWSESIEGHDYWSSINKNIKNHTIKSFTRIPKIGDRLCFKNTGGWICGNLEHTSTFSCDSNNYKMGTPLTIIKFTDSDFGKNGDCNAVLEDIEGNEYYIRLSTVRNGKFEKGYAKYFTYASEPEMFPIY